MATSWCSPLQKGPASLLRQLRSFFAGIAEGYREKRDLLIGGLRETGAYLRVLCSGGACGADDVQETL